MTGPSKHTPQRPRVRRPHHPSSRPALPEHAAPAKAELDPNSTHTPRSRCATNDPTNRPQIPAQRTRRALPPAPTPHEGPTAPGKLKTLWRAAWQPEGPLHRMWDDLRSARTAGWNGTAPWIKALGLTAAFSLTVLLLDAALDVLLHAGHQLLTAAPRVQVGTDTTTGIWAVIDHPVRHYIAAHATGLPVSASTLYTVWLTAGITGLAGGALRLTGCRLLWTAWGAATTAMVWHNSPAHAHALAAGLTVLAWILASTLALRGLSLRPTFFTHVHHDSPVITLTPPAAEAGDDRGAHLHL